MYWPKTESAASRVQQGHDFYTIKVGAGVDIN